MIVQYTIQFDVESGKVTEERLRELMDDVLYENRDRLKNLTDLIDYELHQKIANEPVIKSTWVEKHIFHKTD